METDMVFRTVRSARGIQVSDVPFRACVLIVDDDAEITELSSSILNTHGFETLVAHDGRQVIPLASNHRVDLVLMDLVMPDQEGIETILALRRWNSSIPVIAMGVVNHVNYLNAATLLGAKAVLIKPFLAGDLLAVVNSVLKRAEGEQLTGD